MKKLTALFLAAAMTLSLVACGGKTDETTSPLETTATATESTAENATDSGEENQAITVTDMTGREITLDKPATRIIALSAADCEILYALGCGDTLIGRGEYCDYPAEVLDVPSVKSGMETNLEQIISLNPEVLLMSAMDQTKEQVNMLEQAGITVVVSDADTIADTYESITMIGTLMGKDAEAAQIIQDMESTFAELSEKTAGLEEKTVYFEVSPLEYGLWAAGTGAFMDEIAQILHVKNVFSDVADWGEVSEEQVLERNPDYIVSVAMYFGEGPTPEEEILSRTGWENITAIKEGNVLNVANNELSRPAPRLAEGAKILYEFFYGEE